MIKLTKDYITKLYLILVVFILVLIVCCIVTNPATAFALDDKNTASGTIVLSDVVKNEGYIELKGSPEEIGKVTDAHYIKNYKYFVNSPKHKIMMGQIMILEHVQRLQCNLCSVIIHIIPIDD